MKITNKNKEKNIVKTPSVSSPSTSGLIAFDDFDNWFDDVFPSRWMHPLDLKFPDFPEKSFSLSGELPKVDIIDYENEIKIQAELPGIKKEDVDVSINNQTVTIRASTKHEEKKENGGYFRKEISRGEFQRTLFLPAQVESDKAKASLKDGILELTIPKSEKSKRKTIEIK